MQKEIILRDQLAIDRTILANDRTLYSVIHLALALLVAGLTIIHFFGGGWWHVFGAALVCMSPIVLAAGWWRHRRIYAEISFVTSTQTQEEDAAFS